LFTLDTNNTLVQLGDIQSGATTQTLTATTTVGQPLLVEVKGLETASAVVGAGTYTLTVKLQ
jgi:hypothetical protein